MPILEVEYIKPLEEYCEQTQPCDVPTSFPKLLTLIGNTSEDELDLICRSSLPSFLFQWMVLAKNDNILTEILTHLYLSPQPEVSKLALKALSTQSESDSETRSFLQTLKVPSDSTDSSSELVPFVGRLCGRLAEHVSEMKSLFTESSPSDGTISALSATLPSKSPLLNGNTLLDVLCEGFSLLNSLLINMDNTFEDVYHCLFSSCPDSDQVRLYKEEQKRIRKLQFERVLQPAKQYLQFIFQREEFISNDISSDWDLPTELGFLFARTLYLERDLFEDGVSVETGREEWEVGWLVEKTDEKELGERLEWIREDDVRMKKDDEERWKKRVERGREAGQEDAVERWLTRRIYQTRSEIVEYLILVSEESGMND
ncbi:hypothetical protein BLNAU_18012 [Blattamonas nauphoetae]|uniref:Uncharacterized protein n=1 Tax=Blattamonas nauphoetae TaxID=2049346 RepID=A0ABQ9X5Q2_9EUKA|nr:hypothetical protein BLNAU_18012 [Blattamonas nauphoetae]